MNGETEVARRAERSPLEVSTPSMKLTVTHRWLWGGVKEDPSAGLAVRRPEDSLFRTHVHKSGLDSLSLPPRHVKDERLPCARDKGSSRPEVRVALTTSSSIGSTYLSSTHTQKRGEEGTSGAKKESKPAARQRPE